ncbi:uncharacterized protein PRCAT00004659001 [Priceomyces carsonii]|uniref:uncharacterized protein n=1 Tax=Priceomyces carsonii TaxID=28549 RepID=UPI002ED9DD07|nr:unnamed protein product [Priceomyces carsonii]
MTNEGEICSFCLGGNTDVPPFGTSKDAEALIHPCSTCSLVAHKKCLLDWFNSLPSDKLHIVDSQSLDGVESIRRPRSDNGNDNTDLDQAANETRIHINISAHLLNNLIASLTTGIGSNTTPIPSSSRHGDESDNLRSIVTFFLAPCPQCKEDIVFSMRSSTSLAFNSAVKNLLARSIQYGGLFLGFTSAITGIVSMGYIGLTTCGLKMMDCLIPGPLLVKMLTRKSGRYSPSNYSTLSQILLGNVNSYSIDNLEQALLKGLIDPLKFSRIPVLPLVLYRMRSSSITSCIFGSSKDTVLNNWLTEFMISGYISSLGNHELLKGVFKNFRFIIRRILQDPKSINQGFPLLENIDLLRANNIISMLVPIRWAYDLLSRLILNRTHFKIVMKIRPREIANSVSPNELDCMEDLGAQLGTLELEYRALKLAVYRKIESQYKSTHSLPLITSIHKLLTKGFLLSRICIGRNYLYSFLKLKLLLWLHETKACLKKDYSSSLMSNSITIRALTTVLWPFVSSKVGSITLDLALKYSGLFNSVPKEKVTLLCNAISLVAVVLAKDIFNLYLCDRKAKQLSQMRIVCVDPKNDESSSEPRNENHSANFPGHYPNND